MEQRIASVAGSAHGVVTRAELLRLRISKDEIRHRLEVGALVREYPGVYSVGCRAASLEARYMAAVKACGKGALLCGLAGGHLLGLLKGRPPPPVVMTPTERKVKGLRTRTCRNIHRLDGTKWRGIPMTTVPRTLVDLARDLPLNRLSRAFHEAAVRHDTKPEHVEAVLERRPNSPGAKKLRKVMYGEMPITLSGLEDAFLTQVEDACLPLPQTNIHIDDGYVDCRWPEHPLTVELDSYRYHHTRHAWEKDRRRARAARARGDEFRSYTYYDICEDPKKLFLSELRALLQN